MSTTTRLHEPSTQDVEEKPERTSRSGGGRAPIEGVGKTALMVAAGRAVEDANPDGLFKDPLAATLAGPQGAALIEELAPVFRCRYGKSMADALALRTKFIDDVIIEQTGTPYTDPQEMKSKIHQLVVLGAGMDTRAFRLPFSCKVAMYEVDFPSVLEYKERTLQHVDGTPVSYCKRIVIPGDLRDAGWVEALHQQGFNPKARSFWLLEGLLVYLNEDHVQTLLKTIRSLSAPGSGILMHLAHRDFVTSDLHREERQALADIGAAFLSGVEDPQAFVQDAGWRVAQCVGIQELAKRYDREQVLAEVSRNAMGIFVVGFVPRSQQERK